MFHFFSCARARQFSTVVLGVTALTPAFAQSSTVRIAAPWLRETASGQSVGGGFLSITNGARTADTLTGGTSPVAARVEVHSMSMDGGVMRMRPLRDGLTIPAGQTVELKPGGLHIMLTGLKRPLKRGETVPVTLSFARAGKLAVQFSVQPVTYAGGANDHQH